MKFELNFQPWEGGQRARYALRAITADGEILDYAEKNICMTERQREAYRRIGIDGLRETLRNVVSADSALTEERIRAQREQVRPELLEALAVHTIVQALGAD